MRVAAFSGAVVSMTGIFENFFGSPSLIWQDVSVFGSIKGRVVSTFENPNVLAEYLLLIMPITLVLAITSKNTDEKFAFFCATALDCFCLVLTWSRGAWLGFIFGLILFMLLISKKSLVAGILLLPPAFAVLTFGSGSVFRRLTSSFTASDSSSVYRLNIWKGVLRMLSDTFGYGIGIGESAFASLYPVYAVSGTETAPHSHSLFLQISTEIGVSGLIFFAFLIFIFIQMCISHMSSAILKENRIICIGFFCSVISFLAMGLTDYVFYNYRIILMFWMTVGLAVATINASKNSAGESNDFFY